MTYLPKFKTVYLASIAAFLGALQTGCASLPPGGDPGGKVMPVIVVHGGSGTISKATITPEVERQYRAGLDTALRAGQEVLTRGGSSVDAVVAAIRTMEDNPLFNAGKGAVFTNDGKNEMDASIMNGATGQAGAVAGVSIIKNPVTAARTVMEKSRHVLLVGRGAEAFARAQNLDIVDPTYFFTQHRWNQLQAAKAADAVRLDHDGDQKKTPVPAQPSSPRSDAAPLDGLPWYVDHKYGTVGAVALDAAGNLAAATSTGGLTNKLWGRVGDSPIIGAGTYADNASAALSATGTGEFFMRGLVTYDVTARIKYRGDSLEKAVQGTIQDALNAKQGKGGIIALNRQGQFSYGFNTEGMYRGSMRSGEEPVIHIYRENP